MVLCGSLAGCSDSPSAPLAPELLPTPAAPAPTVPTSGQKTPMVPAPVPTFPTVTEADPPPPISGGTLLITHKDGTAVAADPDRDAVWLVDLQKSQVRARVVLPVGSEPGRAIEDQDGNVHVALRRGGQVVKLDPQTGTILSSRVVCPAPRGLAYDGVTDNLHVACAGGQLVTIAARGGDIPRTVQLDRDLRDVVMKGDHLLISRFRSAELIEVDASGTVVGRIAPRQSVVGGVVDGMGKPVTTTPNTAWRLASLPDGNVLMLHQRAFSTTLPTQTGYYFSNSDPCKGNGIVSTAVTVFAGGDSTAVRVGNGAISGLAVLAVDVAVSPDGQQLAMIGATSASFSQVVPFAPNQLSATDDCLPHIPVPPSAIPLTVQVIAGAYDSSGHLWVQARNPAQLYGPLGTSPITFPNAEDRSNEGHRLFHTPTSGLIACASCHAEAGDDGHVWNFDPIGARRTQSLRGGILKTAPFHWDGAMADFSTLMNQVFTGRMNGPHLTAVATLAVGSWLDAQPGLPKSAPRDPDAVARGQTVFNDPTVGCATCHSGAHFTNNQTVLVGTGQAFQVPSLIDVVGRAPYLHSGCAATLRDRFDPACGGGDAHGHTSTLAATQIDDLVAYLETL